MQYNQSYTPGGSPSGNKANALVWIIGICVGVFIIQCFEHAIGSFILRDIFELSGKNLGRGFIWTFGSYAFLHDASFMQSGGLPLHIVGNMLGVFFIGRILLPILGTARFLQLYFGATLLGGIAWFLASFVSGSSGVIGASGASLGLLTMFACLYPNREIQVLLFFILPVRIKPKILAFIALGISVFGLVFFELYSQTGSRTAHSAHLGGMLGGWLFFNYVYNKNVDLGFNFNFPKWLNPRRPKAGKNSTSKYKYQVDLNSNKPELKREVDRILDKINSKGFGALTNEEKHILDQARDILNRR